MASPRCFISYSWDSGEHREWVLRLARSLERKGVEVLLDQFLGPGANVPHFMESAVRDCDFVVIVCTPSLAAKANSRKGGVGYETQVVTSEIFLDAPDGKFLPILRAGSSERCVPTYARHLFAVDFRREEVFDDSLDVLARHMWGQPRNSPGPVGPMPDFASRHKTPGSQEDRSNGAAVSGTLLTGTAIISVDDKSFDSVVLNDHPKPKLVEFWADWCGPCKMIRPVLEEIARENERRISVVTVDVDECQKIAQQYQVLSIPTLMVFKSGKPVKQIVGARPKAPLLGDLKDYLDEEYDDVAPSFADTLALTFDGGRIRVACVRPDGTYSFLDSKQERHGILYLETESARLRANKVIEFERLINGTRISRSEIVQFLEENPEFITGDEYRSAVSQVYLRNVDASPSFVLQPLNGELCDLLEVEAPQDEIARLVKGVSMLSEVVLEAVARLRAYRDYFEDERNRIRVEDTRGLHIFRPKMFVIIGRSGTIDPVSKRKLETAMGDVTIRTWDDILARARRMGPGFPWKPT